MKALLLKLLDSVYYKRWACPDESSYFYKSYLEEGFKIEKKHGKYFRLYRNYYKWPWQGWDKVLKESFIPKFKRPKMEG